MSITVDDLIGTLCPNHLITFLNPKFNQIVLKLPNFDPFSDSKNLQKVLSRIQLIKSSLYHLNMEFTHQKTNKQVVIIYFNVDDNVGTPPAENAVFEDVEGTPPSMLSLEESEQIGMRGN